MSTYRNLCSGLYCN